MKRGGVQIHFTVLLTADDRHLDQRFQDANVLSRVPGSWYNMEQFLHHTSDRTPRGNLLTELDILYVCIDVCVCVYIVYASRRHYRSRLSVHISPSPVADRRRQHTQPRYLVPGTAPGYDNDNNTLLFVLVQHQSPWPLLVLHSPRYVLRSTGR